MENDVKVNRQYKDRVFKLLFSEKENLLSLFNAVNETNFTEADVIEINTLEDAIYIKMRNDISFILYEYLKMAVKSSQAKLGDFLQDTCRSSFLTGLGVPPPVYF